MYLGGVGGGGGIERWSLNTGLVKTGLTVLTSEQNHCVSLTPTSQKGSRHQVVPKYFVIFS